MRHALRALIVGGAAFLAWPGTASAEVHLAISNGQVTLSAQNATVSQILAEWSRVGQTKIVNGERASGGPMTLELSNVPEAQALDIILRVVSGYLLAPRAASVATASQYDRILILPGTAPVRTAAPTTPQAMFQQQRPGAPVIVNSPMPDMGDEQGNAEQQMPPPRVQAPPNTRPPVFNTFPQPMTPPRAVPPPVNTASPPPAGAPAMPVGVPTPGMVVPVPTSQAPGQVPAADGTQQQP